MRAGPLPARALALVLACLLGASPVLADDDTKSEPRAPKAAPKDAKKAPESKAAESKARRLARASYEARATDPMLALLLAREAFEREPSYHTRTALYDAVVSTRERALFRGHKGPVTAADVTPAGEIVTGGEDGTVRRWQRDGTQTARIDFGRPVRDVQATVDGTFLVATASKTKDRVDLHLLAGDTRTPLGEALADDGYALSRSRDRVLVTLAPGMYALWTTAGRWLTTREGAAARFDPAGRHWLVQSKQGDVEVLDRNGGRVSQITTPTGTHTARFDLHGERVLVYGTGKSVHVHHVRGKRLARLAHTGTIETALFSPAGGMVLTAAVGKLRLWTPDGVIRREVPYRGPLRHAAFSFDGYWLATATDDTLLSLYVIDDGKLSKAKRLAKAIRSVDVTRGHWIRVRHKDDALTFYGVGLNRRHAFGDDDSPCHMSLWGPKQRWNLCAGATGAAVLISVEGRHSVWLNGHRDRIVGARFVGKSNEVLTASRDGTARLWSLHQPGTAVLGGHQHRVYGAALSWTHERLVTLASADLFFWDFQGNERGRVTLSQSPTYYAWCRTRIATCIKKESFARLFDYDGNQLTLLQHGAKVYGVRFSPDGTRVLTWSRTGASVRVYDLGGKPLWTVSDVGPVVRAVFTPTNDGIATLGPSDRIRIWDRSGAVVSDWTLPEPAKWAYLPKGTPYVLTKAKDGSVARLWDRQGNLLADVKGHGGPIITVKFDAQRKWLLTTSRDKTARVTDLGGNEVLRLEHPDTVVSVHLLPGKNRIGTACKDGVYRLWSTRGDLLALLRGHKDALIGLRVSKDGEMALTRSKDRSARLWPVTDEALSEVAKRRIGRDFTPEERKRYAELLAP